jgi:phage nucleotide-binding protein
MTVQKRKLKTSNSTFQVQPVGALPSTIAALIYGRSGTGKTTISSSFPKPILLLDIRERGYDSISNVPQTYIAEVGTWAELEEVYWYIKANPTKYKTVVLDQVTQMQTLALEKVRADEGKDSEDVMSQRSWGRISGLMTTWLMNYRDLIDLGIHVVFLAHDRLTDSDDQSGDDQIDPVVGPRIMPSVSSFLTGIVKLIGNTFIRERFSIVNKRKVRSVEYAMRIGPHAYYLAKTRSPVGIQSPDVIVNPTYDQMVAVMEGSYKIGDQRKSK